MGRAAEPGAPAAAGNLLDVVAGGAAGTAFGVLLWLVVLNRLAEPAAPHQR